MQVCAVTGYRPSRFPFKGNEDDIRCKKLKEEIKKEVKYLYEQGVHTFWLGGAEGVDMWAGEILIQLKSYKAYNDIKIMLAIPFEGYNKNWKDTSIKRLENIKKNSEEIIIVGSNKEPKEEQYRKRNKYMTDKADCLLTVFDKEKIIVRSGTNMTFQFALKKGISIFVVDSSFCDKVSSVLNSLSVDRKKVL